VPVEALADLDALARALGEPSGGVAKPKCLSGIKAGDQSGLGLGVDRLESNMSLCAAPLSEVHHVDPRDSSPA
jgi:hypothetical protein